MRVLWHSNAAHVASGYGVQTQIVTRQMQEAGHDVAIAALWGLEGGMMGYPGPKGPIPCYPKGHAQASMDLLPSHAAHYQADVVLSHYDAWTMNVEKLGRPWVPWFPVDTDRLSPIVYDAVKRGAYRITQTRHGQAAVEARDLQCARIPAAFDSSVYYPRGKTEVLGPLAKDRFIVGVVAANRGNRPCRKAFPQILEAFKLFHDKHPEAMLYLQTRLDTTEGGCDMVKLLEHFEVPEDSFLTTDQYGLIMGIEPPVMAQIYSALDVFLLPSMGEGFGVPLVEAQACGVPVITGGWTAMEELAVTGYAIPKTDATRYYQENYGDWFIARPEAIADALEESMDWSYDPAEVSAGVQEYEAGSVWRNHWVPVLEEIEAQVAPAPNREQRRAERRRMKVKKGGKAQIAPAAPAADPLLAAIEAG